MMGVPALAVAAAVAASAAAAAAAVGDFIDPMRHEIFMVTPKSFDNMVSQYRNQNGVVVLLHYSSEDTAQRKYIDSTLNGIATDLKGMVRFGGVNCHEYPVFCKTNENPEVKTPRLILYPPAPFPPQTLENHSDVKAVTNAALRYIPGKTVNVLATSDDATNFLSADNLAIPKMLFFSDKKKPPALIKALANHFHDRIGFGFVPADSSSGLAAKYSVKKPLPKALLLRVSSKGGSFGAPEHFTGKSFTYETLHDWLNVHAETFVKGGGFADGHDGGSGQPREKPWLHEKLPEMTGLSYRDVCFGGADLCGIVLSVGPVSESARAAVEDVRSNYNDLVKKWSWMDIEREPAFRELFGLTATKNSSFAVVNPKKSNMRFVTLPEDAELTAASLGGLLERVGSGVTYKRIKGNKLPSFSARKATADEL